MSQRAVSILFVLTALLLGYVLLFERTSVTSRELEQRKGRVLQTFVRDRVDKLEIEAHGKKVVLERKPAETAGFESWKMLAPVKTGADEDAVDQVLGELEWLSARRTFEKPSDEDVKAFGLNAPRYRLWFSVGGKRHSLDVGNDDVHGQGVYVRTEDKGRVFVVPKTLLEALDHGPGRYRTKEFLGNIVLAWVRQVELERGVDKLTLTRSDDQWQYQGEAPVSFADARRIDRLLSSLDDLRATRFLEEGPQLEQAKALLAQPEASVRVRVVPDTQREDQTPRLFDLRVAGACPEHPEERVAQSGPDGDIVCVRAADLELFTPDYASLRQQTLLGVEPSQVEAFELVSGGKTIALKRDGENWVAGGNLPANREAVEVWLQEVAAIEARDFTQPVAETPESGRLVISRSGGKQQVFVSLGLGPNRSLRVRRGSEAATVEFPARLSDLLAPIPTRFQSLVPWDERKPSEVSAVDVKAENFVRSLSLGEGGWGVQGKALPASDEFRVRELVKQLLKTRALAFVTDRAREEHGFAATPVSVSFKLQGADAKPVTLRAELGAQTSRGHYARFDDGAVFEVEPAMYAEILELAGGPAASATTAARKVAEPEDEHDEDHDHHHHEH